MAESKYDDAKAGQSDVFECYAMQSHDFEGMSVKDLRALVESGNAADITTVGHALLDAHGEITDIANQLKGYVAKVDWQGEGASAFQDWGNQFANQSLKLAHVAYVAGDHMSAAGYALGQAQSAMQGLHPDAKPNSADHNEAITQVGKVASTYVTAREVIKGEQMPNFQPLPTISSWKDDSFLSGRPYGLSNATSNAGSSDAGSYGGVTPKNERTDGFAGGTASPHGISTATHIPGVPAGDTAAHTSLDSRAPVATVPPTVSHGVERPKGPSTTQPGGMPVPPPLGGPGLGLGTVPPRGPIGLNGRPTNVGGLGEYRPPTLGKVPNEPGGDGIVGGIPSRSGASMSSPRMPRATVIGGEGEPTAPRGSMFRGPMASGASEGGGGLSPRGPMGPGRRLASELGGVVSEVRGSGSGAREFTPGGSGLVREGQGAGMVPSAGVRSASGRRTSTARPDYLEEDEETWDVSRQDVVPGVIN
ncbi:WXG100 family type VII secretion target [Streptantibioticus ferralitis]|uniref:WXG100 family type VII secretion target n=1 Tax=Streptantibioticus ferralitis TaxID=236510 RepID=A0ABT5ZAA0_9ACTN|nr:WXG100 family type VII secretion target [Streptantibioticus ferralitis]MDF2260749.1 WXG100 family type VII secretion target [Streptantibioticus ferralitis]